jgi:uncharacterized paraquat-inducible protein A
MDEKPTIDFKCLDCKLVFKCGIIDIDRHTIFCPRCNTEIPVDTEIGLYEYDCPLLDDYLKKKNELGGASE